MSAPEEDEEYEVEVGRPVMPGSELRPQIDLTLYAPPLASSQTSAERAPALGTGALGANWELDMEPSNLGPAWLSAKLVPILAALGGVAFAVAEIAADHTIADTVAKKVLSLLVLVGITSPGWRKA